MGEQCSCKAHTLESEMMTETMVLGTILTVVYLFVTIVTGHRRDRSITLPQVLVSGLFGFMTAYGLSSGNKLLLIGPPLLFSIALAWHLSSSKLLITKTFRFRGRWNARLPELLRSRGLEMEQDGRVGQRWRDDSPLERWLVRGGNAQVVLWIQNISIASTSGREREDHEDSLISLQQRGVHSTRHQIIDQSSLLDRIAQLLVDAGATEVNYLGEAGGLQPGDRRDYDPKPT